MRRLIWGVCGLVLIAPVLYKGADQVTVSSLQYTCALCRFSRLDRTCLGMTHSQYSENDCSRWYASHVEPTHSHLWQSSTCRYTTNLARTWYSYGCKPGEFSLFCLDRDDQLAFYEHFADPAKAKAVFLKLADETVTSARIEGVFLDFMNVGRLTTTAIGTWVAADFPGTWEEWLAKSYAEYRDFGKE